ncbi:MAG: tRNA adenosine(34) deaminase TadA [Candidatus Eutrophobiaceae bacterium]
MIERDAEWMARALALASEAARLGEVPVGAVLVCNNGLVGEGANASIRDCDPSAHAEIVALRGAARRIGNYRLGAATLYVTLEPCAMCAGAMLNARIERLVYAVADPRAGAAGSALDVLSTPTLNHKIFVDAFAEDDPQAVRSAALLKDFFHECRI